MPNNKYRYLKWNRRVTDFPFTHAVAIALFVQAFVLIAAYGPSTPGAHMESLLLCFAIPATLAILMGLQWKGSVITGYGIESVGHFMGAGAWIIVGWITLVLGGTFTIVAPMLLTVAHLLRARRLILESNAIRSVIVAAAKRAEAGS